MPLPNRPFQPGGEESLFDLDLCPPPPGPFFPSPSCLRLCREIERPNLFFHFACVVSCISPDRKPTILPAVNNSPLAHKNRNFLPSPSSFFPFPPPRPPLGTQRVSTVVRRRRRRRPYYYTRVISESHILVSILRWRAGEEEEDRGIIKVVRIQKASPRFCLRYKI